MPTIFLSPSTQTYNLYITGGNERDHMNHLADTMQPFLDLACIMYSRNDPDGNVRISVEMSNAGDYDLHVPLHSNAAPEALSGQFRGPLVMHYPGSVRGERAAEYVAQALADIYPEPDKVILRPESNLFELAQTRAPSVFVEVAYHDNMEDALWIENNTIAIADHLTEGIANYFGLPYANPNVPFEASVNIGRGHLNVHSIPGIEYPNVGRLERGERVTVLRQIPCWSYIRMPNGETGYACSQYLRVI